MASIFTAIKNYFNSLDKLLLVLIVVLFAVLFLIKGCGSSANNSSSMDITESSNKPAKMTLSSDKSQIPQEDSIEDKKCLEKGDVTRRQILQNKQYLTDDRDFKLDENHYWRGQETDKYLMWGEDQNIEYGMSDTGEIWCEISLR